MRNRVSLVLAVLVLLPAALLAQSPQARISAAKARAKAAGIPVSLLENKVAEGKAKGVPMDRIATAVERRQEVLARALEAMGRRQRVSSKDLSIGADALQSGVSEAALRTLAETAPGERRAVAIATLTQLVQMGQGPDQALQRVTEALEGDAEALSNLPARAAAGRGRPDAPPGKEKDRGKKKKGGGEEAAFRGAARGARPPALPAPGRKPGAGRSGGPPTGGN